MILQYQIRLNDYLEAQRTYRLRMSKRRSIFRNLPGLALLAAVVGTYVRLSGYAWLGDAMYLVAIYLVMERAFLWKGRSAALYRDTPELHGPFELTIDENHLMRKTAAGEDEIRWASILGCHETKTLFLLQLDTGEFLALPKRALSPVDAVTFQELRKKELLVKTTRDNPDSMLLKFAFAWALVAVVAGTLCIGFVHIFLLGLARAPRVGGRNATQVQPEVKPAAALPQELEGQGDLYLVPVGAIKSVPIPALLEAIQKRYGTPIRVLPPIPAPTWGWNPNRKQYVAEDLLAAIKLGYPKLAADPHARIIGLTDGDMYIAALAWQYAFSDRQEERFAIVSSWRLALGDDDKPVSQDLLKQRISKMMLREIGVLYYRLQESGDERGLVSADIDDASDLDGLDDAYLTTDASMRADIHVKFGDPCFTLRHYTEPQREHPITGVVAACKNDNNDTDLETLQIDLRSGSLLVARRDFFDHDRIPLELNRVLRTQNPSPGAFGVGGNHNYNWFLVGDRWPFTWINLSLETGDRLHFSRSNWGIGYWDALYTNQQRVRNGFSGSTIRWAWPGWKLMAAGKVYRFADGGATNRPEQAGLISVQGYNGDLLTLSRDAQGNLLHARAPSGSELTFRYDQNNRVTEVLGQGGKTFKYYYHPNGHLSQVIDADNRVTTYGYDEFGRLNQVAQDGKMVCTLRFGGKDRVISERLADGRTYNFNYSTFNDVSSAVEINDSGGPVRFVRVSSVDYSVDTLDKSK